MSNPEPQLNPYVGKPVVLPPPQENGLGIAGFIVSVIGIITCGTLSIIGVIISAIGLGKEPKGMAIAGLIIGLIGLVELAGFGFLMFAGIRGAQQIGQGMQQIIVQTQLETNAAEISEVWSENDRVPSQEEGDELVAGTLDVWGNPIAYETDDAGFSLRSPGQDGVPMTEDDIVVGPFADPESAKKKSFDGGNFERKIDGIEGFDDLEDQLKEQLEEMESAMEKPDEDLKSGNRDAP